MNPPTLSLPRQGGGDDSVDHPFVPSPLVGEGKGGEEDNV
jgi:hypothetical protein